MNKLIYVLFYNLLLTSWLSPLVASKDTTNITRASTATTNQLNNQIDILQSQIAILFINQSWVALTQIGSLTETGTINWTLAEQSTLNWISVSTDTITINNAGTYLFLGQGLFTSTSNTSTALLSQTGSASFTIPLNTIYIYMNNYSNQFAFSQIFTITTSKTITVQATITASGGSPNLNSLQLNILKIG